MGIHGIMVPYKPMFLGARSGTGGRIQEGLRPKPGETRKESAVSGESDDPEAAARTSSFLSAARRAARERERA